MSVSTFHVFFSEKSYYLQGPRLGRVAGYTEMSSNLTIKELGIKPSMLGAWLFLTAFMGVQWGCNGDIIGT